MSIRARIYDTSVRLGSVQALDQINLEVESGQFLALLGPSGSGKTTTLNVLAGFVRPDSGSVTFDGTDVTHVSPHSRDIGIVFQGYALFPHMTVAENVGFPLKVRKLKAKVRATKVRDALALVGLDSHADRSVSALSGGQRQRVALARAIVFEPRMMLLDEPLAALDKQLRDAMQLEIRALQQRVGITTVAVTHDQVEALTMADVVAVMRDGRIEQMGPPRDLYLRPATQFVATFLGEANLLRVDNGHLPGFGRIGNAPARGEAIVRPEHVTFGRPGESRPDMLSARAVVERVLFQGARLRVKARLEGAPTIELTLSDVPSNAAVDLGTGETIDILLDPRDVHVIADSQDDGQIQPTKSVIGSVPEVSS